WGSTESQVSPLLQRDERRDTVITVRIVDVRTTVLRQPDVPGIQDATIRHRDTGRSVLFVHILTDDGIEGLGVGTVVARGIVENSPKPMLLEQDPLRHEKLWDDMFWRVRGYGRKGVALCAISAVDIASICPSRRTRCSSSIYTSRAVRRTSK